MPVLDGTDIAAIRAEIDAAIAAALPMDANVTEWSGAAVTAGAIPAAAAGGANGLMILGDNSGAGAVEFGDITVGEVQTGGWASSSMDIGSILKINKSLLWGMEILSLSNGAVVIHGGAQASVYLNNSTGVGAGIYMDISSLNAIKCRDGGGNLSNFDAGLAATLLSQFFTVSSGETHATSVAGSVVQEIADNASGGGGVTMADFFTVDSGETFATAVAGSVIKELADNVNVVSLNDGIITEDSFTEPTFTGEPTGWMQKLLWLCHRFGIRRVVKDKVAKTITTYEADAVTPATTQDYISDTAADDLGPIS